MKKVLITGANSYIGSSFESYMSQKQPDCIVDAVDMIDGSWREKDFGEYDVVFHVAGIVHLDMRKDKKRENLYYKINRDLAIETAKKAKSEGVKQFIFMSTASVYGATPSIRREKNITKETPPQPKNFYGDSKLQAENGIIPLGEDGFNVVVLRPPMIFGENCKGNYVTLSKIAKKTPIFPYVKNQRSMIYIENFLEFVRLVIKNEERGIFFPQNKEFYNTSETVQYIGEIHGKKIKLLKGFSWALRILGIFTSAVNKAFGNFCYDKSLSEYKEEYCFVDNWESIKKTEK